MRYEDVAKGAGSLLGRYDFLGERYDRTTVESVLSVKHSCHKKAPGRLHSDVPRFVRVNKRLEGTSFLVADRFEIDGDSVQIGGLMLSDAAASPRRFRRVLDASGRPVKFQASLGLTSRRLAEKLGSEAAGKARFLLSFTRNTDDEEYRVFLDNESLAMTVYVPPPKPA